MSLIQSNASGFGSWLVEPNTQINLHDRGLGFNLAGRAPRRARRRAGARRTRCCRRWPPSTDRLDTVFGSMGGDAQPQIVLQLAARLFRHGQSPAEAVHAGRWALRGPVTGFDTWTAAGGPVVSVEGHASAQWADGLARRGHPVHRAPAFDSGFGHGHVIRRGVDGVLAGAADPRTWVGAVAGR